MSAQPTPDDKKAAHEFLTELRTRISTQPLPYQYGVEARALESLWEIFGHARQAIKKYPDCRLFAQQTTDMLNVELRPVTAKWHRAHTEGRLKSRDGSNEFREDLEEVQVKLRAFASELHKMAYGQPGADALTPEVMNETALAACRGEVQFGIVDMQPSEPATGEAVDTPKRSIKAATTEEINKAESDAIAARREKLGIKDRNNAVGLALSGGGIRSATFCLGVVQVLADKNLLQDADYLSTVSGGGYTGSFLTQRLTSKEAYKQVGAPHGPDTPAIRYLRQNAKYLMATDLKARWAMVMATLGGMVLNWTAPIFVVALAALGIAAMSLGLGSKGVSVPWPSLLAAGGGATALGLLVYGATLRYAAAGSIKLLSFAVAFTLFVAFCWLAVVIDPLLGAASLPVSLTVGTIAAATPTLIRFLPVLRKPAVRKLVLQVALVAAGLLVPLGAAALAWWFYHVGMEPGDWGFWASFVTLPGWIVLLVLCAVPGLVAALLLDINLTGPHRLYRDALAKTFVQTSATGTTPVPLTNINANGFAPYHLLNATVNLPSSTSEVLRERKSDFFMFSKAYCGAPSLKYHATGDWKARGKVVDLATAMAVSGAAASSYMGLGSYPTLTALLTFLNARLGFWLRRPGTWGLNSPGFLCLLREMTGVAMSENNRWINLSDGGHIENMAVYELLRRRCKFIVSIDGEADPESTFHGHLTLVRHAQIDFGIRIEPDLSNLRPEMTSRFSQSHAMLARVHYPEGMGLILYIKLSVTGDEAELIKRYRALNPDFPHQTTLDQFFDEEQFEAYRQLGVHVAEGLFARALLHGVAPPTIADWIEGLAKSLLEPER